MSKIAITPNASGTAVFTLAAPNTNTDRTLTLPDQTGTILTGSGAIGVNASAANNSMVIDASGNVGIGTNSPTQKLDVASKIVVNTSNAYGKINIARATDSSLSALYIQGADNAGTSNELSLVNGGGGGAAINITGGDIRFYASSNTTERMRIDASGNVYVGGTSSVLAGRFNSIGTSTQWAGVMQNSGGASYDALIVQNTSTTGNNRFIGFGTEASYTERGYIYYDRAAGQTKLSATSDYRAKDIEGLTENALDIVNAIPVHNAKLKWAEGNAYPMYIAHELQKVAPWAVSGKKDAVDEEGNPIYQTVSYESMVATLTKAIQEQQALITQLQADVAALKGAK